MSYDFRLGFVESKALMALERSGASVVSSRQLRDWLGLPSARVNKVAFQLVGKKRLIPVRKGWFVYAPLKSGLGGWSQDPWAVAASVMEDRPYYISYRSALHHHGLTEQIPHSVQVVTTARVAPFSACGARFEFTRRSVLGESETVMVEGRPVRVATIEQAIVDGLADPGCSGGVKELAKALWNARRRVDWRKLKAMAARESEAVVRRLGYLCAVLKIASPTPPRAKGLRWLDPSRPHQAVGLSSAWGLRLNVGERELTDWKET